MARNPADLLQKLATDEKRQVDRLERMIDARMDAQYEGGTFTFDLDGRIKNRAIEELRRRYSKWTIRVDRKCCSDPREPYDYDQLVFDPK